MNKSSVQCHTLSHQHPGPLHLVTSNVHAAYFIVHQHQRLWPGSMLPACKAATTSLPGLPGGTCNSILIPSTSPRPPLVDHPYLVLVEPPACEVDLSSSSTSSLARSPTGLFPRVQKWSSGDWPCCLSSLQPQLPHPGTQSSFTPIWCQLTGRSSTAPSLFSFTDNGAFLPLH